VVPSFGASLTGGVAAADPPVACWHSARMILDKIVAVATKMAWKMHEKGEMQRIEG
jgi:hypothetical protein